jgi:hypothetical protein
MRAALVITPNYAAYSVPLGFATLKSFLEAAGHQIAAYDIEQHLRSVDRDLLHRLHSVFYHRLRYEDVVWFRRPDLLVWLLQRAPSDHDGLPADERRVVEAAVDYLDPWADRILAARPECVLFTTYITNVFASLALARALKRRADVPVIFGGPGSSLPACREFCLRAGWVDVCVAGEGEMAAAALLNGAGLHDATAATSASFLEGGVVRTSVTAPVLPPSHWATPDFSGLPASGLTLDAYRPATGLFVVPIAATRGCPLKCAFCSETNYWETFRRREPADVVDEIRRQYRRWGSRYFTFCDSTINFSTEWMDELCGRLIADGPSVVFTFAFARPHGLTRARLERMYRSGFRCLYYGIESGSNRLLRSLGKGTTAEEILQVVGETAAAGIAVGANLTWGFPREDDQDFLESLLFLERLQQFKSAQPAAARRISINATARFRLEAYSRYYRQRDQFGITVSRAAVPLPPEVEAGRSWITPLFERWDPVASESSLEWKLRLLDRYSDGQSVPTVPVFDPQDAVTRRMLSASDRFRAGAGAELDADGRVRAGSGRVFRVGAFEAAVFELLSGGRSIGGTAARLRRQYDGAVATLVRAAAVFYLSEGLLEYVHPVEPLTPRRPSGAESAPVLRADEVMVP